MDTSNRFLKGKEFSLVIGGPFFQLLHRFNLTGDALELVKKRIITISLFVWLPLLLLSMINGQAWGHTLTVPFVQDFEIHIRFLIALPLMIVAELVVHDRMLLMVNQFKGRHLIPEGSMTQFDNAISSALRLRNSVTAEGLMLVITYVIGFQIVWEKFALNASAWYLQPDTAHDRLSLAGIWFRFVSLPLFQFFLLRWYYRIFIWARFLFQVSRMKLHLVPTHPDDVGGLGFLSNSVQAFMPLALVHGALLAGMISNNIIYQGAKLLDFKFEIILIVILMLCIVILPLFSFMPLLSKVKIKGNMEYGMLSSHFVLGFEGRWMKAKEPLDISAVGHDIQSLSDLSTSYNVVKNMKILPIDTNSILMLILITVAPVLPLVLTMMPFSELIKMLAGILI